MLIDALGDVGEGTSQVTRPPGCLPEFQEPTSDTQTGYVLSSMQKVLWIYIRRKAIKII